MRIEYYEELMKNLYDAIRGDKITYNESLYIYEGEFIRRMMDGYDPNDGVYVKGYETNGLYEKED